MAGLTLDIAEAKLALYLAAETKILAGQAVEMDGHRLTRADLRAVQEGIAIWQGRCQQLTATGNGRLRVFEVIPR
jgi:hypothetical protein